MPPERQQQIRSALSSRYDQKEDIMMKSRSTKRLIAVLAVVAMMVLFTIVSFAYGDQIIEMLTGGRIESGQNKDGHYVSISLTEGSAPAEVRDGQVYFTLGSSDKDITSHCTEATYYEHEHIADHGYRHVVIVGGTADSLGWGEFIWDANGHYTGGTAYHPSIDGEQPEWLRLANERFRTGWMD